MKYWNIVSKQIDKHGNDASDQNTILMNYKLCNIYLSID